MLVHQTIFIAIGMILVVLAIPLAIGKISPNHLYGLRVQATRSDRQVWYEANAKSGRDLLCQGVLQIGFALMLSQFDVTEQTYVTANIILLLIGLLGCCSIGWIRANRLIRAKNRANSSSGEQNGVAMLTK